MRPRWLWFFVIGETLTIASAMLAVYTGRYWAWTSIIGFAVFMAGSVWICAKLFRFHELSRIKSLTVVGIGSGALAAVGAVLVEDQSIHTLGLSSTLWLSGPIEESLKLLVPMLLLWFGSRRFREPRVGLYLVMVSAATFGALEGAEWETDPTQKWMHLEMAIMRPSVELLHTYLTGFVAPVVWLSARRAGQALTTVGAKAVFGAITLHSVHDGLVTFSRPPVGGYQPPSVGSAVVAIGRGIEIGLLGVVIAYVVFQLFRYSSRELVAPSILRTCPPRWRPRIKDWGAHKHAPYTQPALDLRDGVL
jgi:hypothetical protein